MKDVVTECVLGFSEPAISKGKKDKGEERVRRKDRKESSGRVRLKTRTELLLLDEQAV
jgi:hypothetical protein